MSATIFFGDLCGPLEGGHATYKDAAAAREFLIDSFRKGQANRELYVIESTKGEMAMAKKGKIAKTEGRKPVLAPFVSGSFKIYGTYNGREVEATVHADGFIHMDGKVYATPSAAAQAITKKAVAGYIFWKYNKDGERVMLDRIRGSKSPLECIDTTAKPRAKKEAKPKAAKRAPRKAKEAAKPTFTKTEKPDVTGDDIPEEAA